MALLAMNVDLHHDYSLPASKHTYMYKHSHACTHSMHECCVTHIYLHLQCETCMHAQFVDSICICMHACMHANIFNHTADYLSWQLSILTCKGLFTPDWWQWLVAVTGERLMDCLFGSNVEAEECVMDMRQLKQASSRPDQADKDHAQDAHLGTHLLCR